MRRSLPSFAIVANALDRNPTRPPSSAGPSESWRWSHARTSGRSRAGS